MLNNSKKLFILLIFVLSLNSSLYSQNDINIELTACEIKKQKYLSLLLKITNDKHDSVVLRFEPLVRLSLDTMYSYLLTWNSLIDNLNNEMNPKIDNRKKRIKPRPVNKWKDFKLKSKCGDFLIERGDFHKLLKLKSGETIEIKMILILSKYLYKALDRGTEYKGVLIYNSDYLESKFILGEPNSILVKDSEITEGIKFQGEFTFKR